MVLNLKTTAIAVICITVALSGCSSQSVRNDSVSQAKTKQKVLSGHSADVSKNHVNAAAKNTTKAVGKARLASNTPPIYQARKLHHTAWGKQRAGRLIGDFAQNPQTHAFINMMVAQHGFDRGHLNYLFSHTKATDFLQRMAYSDAYKIRKSAKARKGAWSRYRRLFLTEKTIQQGVQFWRQNRVALQRAEQRYGVPQEYILGIIGVETRYGGNVGKNRAIDALATMGFNNPRRGKYFQSELKSYLLMTRRTGIDPLHPKSSYAGALGLCQFMPSNIKRYGVDHDRSGACNLWTASDAIGSVANYFKKHGWRTGGHVAVSATTKGNKYRNFKSSYKRTHSLAKMQKNGVYPVGPIDQSVRFLRLSTYAGDEVWLAGHNFYVITRYNHSTKYAMAVHQLAQAIKSRIKGNKPTRMASLNSSLYK